MIPDLTSFMMLPRRGQVDRILGVTILLCTGIWLFTTLSRDHTHNMLGSHDPSMVRALRQFEEEGVAALNNQTVLRHSVIYNKSAEHEHHISNDSVKVTRPVNISRLVELDLNTSGLHPPLFNNQTLEHLRKNMTLLKANMSGLMELVRKVNTSSPYQNNLHVANPHPFHYLLNAPHLCLTKKLFLLVYVHTAPDHVKRRNVIRHTWGNPKYYKDVNIRVVFIMGRRQAETTVQHALAYEADTYGDIVQEDFEDSYKNLTYKGIAGLKWVSNYCSHARFILKTDDDIFVNMFTLLRHLLSLDIYGQKSEKMLMCLVWNRMKVMRTGKWKVDENEFKDDYYPTYCSGSAYTMSTDVAIALHNASYQVPFFWVDDFYITGLLPMKVGWVQHKQFMSTYVLDGTKLAEKFTGPQWFTYVFSHLHDLDKIQSVWDHLVLLAGGQSVPEIAQALPGEVDGIGRKYKQWLKEEEEKKKKKKT